MEEKDVHTDRSDKSRRRGSKDIPYIISIILCHKYRALREGTFSADRTPSNQAGCVVLYRLAYMLMRTLYSLDYLLLFEFSLGDFIGYQNSPCLFLLLWIFSLFLSSLKAACLIKFCLLTQTTDFALCKESERRQKCTLILKWNNFLLAQFPEYEGKRKKKIYSLVNTVWFLIYLS